MPAGSYNLRDHSSYTTAEICHEDSPETSVNIQSPGPDTAAESPGNPAAVLKIRAGGTRCVCVSRRDFRHYVLCQLTKSYFIRIGEISFGSGDYEAGLLLRISVHMHTQECSNSEGAMVMKLFRTELPAGVYGH